MLPQQRSQSMERILRERIAVFRELCRRASPRQIQIALYVMRLQFVRQQAPDAAVDADIKRVQDAIASDRLDEIKLPTLH